jgi:two-component system OmpR family sensor kinase
MGRLFWKLFLILWLAQICTVVGVGAVFWIKHRNETAAVIEQRHPMDGAVLDLAASLLRHEGSAGLRSSWKACARGRDYLYIVDDHGHELLGRSPGGRPSGPPSHP